MDREEIIKEARTWLGTPFHHQGRFKGFGVDCAGLIVKTAETFNYPIDDIKGYAPSPNANVFKQTVENHFDKIELADIQKGDILIFAFGSEPQHIAFVTDINPTCIIHSYSRVRKVVEHLLDAKWENLIRGAYKFKGIK